MNHRLKGDEAGLVGYWPLNEGRGEIATDKAGNNQGTIHGGAWGQEVINVLRSTSEATPSAVSLATV